MTSVPFASSSKTAGKIADFFDIQAGLLFLPKIIKLKDPMKIPSIAKFYTENIENGKFFIANNKDNSVTRLLREEIILESIMDVWTRSNEIVSYVNKANKYNKYKSLFNIRSVSKALSRIYAETDLLDRDDLRKNGKVFVYKRKI